MAHAFRDSRQVGSGMHLLIFPTAFMANTFAMMLVMIGLSLFGRPELAAEFGLIHGATVALFYSFSGNARSLILAEAREVGAAEVLRLRLLLLLPLAAVAWLLCIGVSDSGWLFMLLLVLRRAVEWLAEIFLSEQELHHRAGGALRFLLIQGALSISLLLVLLRDGPEVEAFTLVWALSPLFGCMSLELLRRAMDRPLAWRVLLPRLLPHVGSTAVIGVSVYVFRLFILLLAGKEVAGDLFSAFALGGILGAVFSQALGPTMIRHEQGGAAQGRLYRLFHFVLFALLLLGVVLAAVAWLLPHWLDWTHKTQLFWLAVGFSLVGGAVMVLAQRIRLRIIQSEAGGDVFGSDMLANLLLVASIPLIFQWLGLECLVVLYLLGALLSLAFYASERGGLLGSVVAPGLSERAMLTLLMVLIMWPLLFQLVGLATDTAGGGGLASWPLPLSVLFCGLGVLLLGGYSRVRTTLLMAFCIFLGMLLSYLLGGEAVGAQGGDKLMRLVHYALPVLVLILGQQFGRRPQAIACVALACLIVVLTLVPPLLWEVWWRAGPVHAAASAINPHLQLVSVLFVVFFWVSVFALSERLALVCLLLALAPAVSLLAVLSQSSLAMGLMLLAGLAFVFRFLCLRRAAFVGALGLALLAGSVLGYSQIKEQTYGLSQASSNAETAMESAQRIRQQGSSLSGMIAAPESLWFGLPAAGQSGVHSYYIDIFYGFGVLGLLPLLLSMGYTATAILTSRGWHRGRLDVLGLAGVVSFFFWLLGSSPGVGLRLPHLEIMMFFFWGLLLAGLQRPAVKASMADEGIC